MSTAIEGQSQAYNAPPIKVTDRDQATVKKVEHTDEGPVMVPDVEVNKQLDELAHKLESTGWHPVPELFQNLRTILLARDVGPNEKTSAAKALLHNLKEGSYNAQTYAHQVLLELLTHDRLRGK